MQHEQEPRKDEYPHGRGYGHDYMRGGEVYGGYGYSERDEYERTRGESQPHEHAPGSSSRQVQ
jgi:hypothetical protein